jgi:formylmethanofuran dehydrogenase subunit D
MEKLTVILITGRSTKQGTGISIGKEHAEYQEATNLIQLSRADMARSGLADGDLVQLKSEFGTAEVKCRRGDLPEGLGFMAYGPTCNKLIGDETYACGMPDSKSMKIEIETV